MRLTSNAPNRPRIIRLKHFLQQRGYDRELHHTPYGGGDERGPDAEAEEEGDERVEADKGEREPNVRVGERHVLAGAWIVHCRRGIDSSFLEIWVDLNQSAGRVRCELLRGRPGGELERVKDGRG